MEPKQSTSIHVKSHLQELALASEGLDLHFLIGDLLLKLVRPGDVTHSEVGDFFTEFIIFISQILDRSIGIL